MSSPSQWNIGPWNSFQWNQVTPGGPAQGNQPLPPGLTPILDGQIIPLTNAPYQYLQVTLAINGGTLTLNLIISFNEVGQFWVMQVFDQFGNALLSDVPLLTGYWPAANILGPWEYMQIGSAFVIANTGTPADSDWPGVTGWGAGGFQLLWASN